MIGGGLGMGAPRAPSLCPLCPYLHNPTWGFTQRYKKGTRCTVSVRLERYLPTLIASSLLLFSLSFSYEVSASTPPLFAFSYSRHSDVGEGRALVGRMSGPTSIIVCSSLRLLGGDYDLSEGVLAVSQQCLGVSFRRPIYESPIGDILRARQYTRVYTVVYTWVYSCVHTCIQTLSLGSGLCSVR